MRFIYDKRDNRIFKTCGIAFTAIFVIAFLIRLPFDMAGNVGTIAVICALLDFFCPIPAIASWYGYWESSRYIKKLAEGGVEVPEDKKLDPVTDKMPVYGDEQDSRESVILAALCGIVAFVTAVIIARYYIRWYPLIGKECTFMVSVQLVLLVLWCIGASVYYRQRRKEKFRDKTVFDPSRKERTGLARGILTIVLCVFISAAALRVAESMTDYVYRSRLEMKYGEHYRDHIGEPAIYGEMPEQDIQP